MGVKLFRKTDMATDVTQSTKLDISVPPVESLHEVVLPHRSHDPATNQKRADPFQFGSRYLQETDNVFEFNAWDHVETDNTYKEYAEGQYAKQRESPVTEFDKSKIPCPPLLENPLCTMMITKCIVHLKVFGSMNETTSATSFAPI